MNFPTYLGHSLHNFEKIEILLFEFEVVLLFRFSHRALIESKIEWNSESLSFSQILQCKSLLGVRR